jgi:uncharacterized repeat protein (TIGR03803 family)
MRSKKLSLELTAVLVIFAVIVLAAGTRAVAQEEKLLHVFDGKNGNSPFASLIMDASGNLYGTTWMGGAYNCGAVFELTPAEGGGWTEKILHNFNNNGTDGYSPYANLIFDGSGNLYGTTEQGGGRNGGVVFELTPKFAGGWAEKILHSFNNVDSTGGYFLEAGLIFDGSGNLYGTARSGGAYGGGVVFELSHKAGGGWTEQVLHSFADNGTDGYYPLGSLIFDASGNLYGTTETGGNGTACDPVGCGMVFELTPTGGEDWTENVLYNFGNGGDGTTPYAGLIFDGAGNLYGTTLSGGLWNYGTAFELTAGTGGSWTETVLHSFGLGTDASLPASSLILDATGNLYGTATRGDGNGIVFELSREVGGGWTEVVLHNFEGTKDGSNPYASLIFDGAGNLYGTTENGGFGTVFEITP